MTTVAEGELPDAAASSDFGPALRSRYEAYLGDVSAGLGAQLERSPEYFERFMGMVDVPRRRAALTELEQALIGVAVVGNVAHHHPGRLDAYLDVARRQGASAEELHDALQLASVLGVHALTVGVAAVTQALQQVGVEFEPLRELDERRLRLKEAFVEVRGYWHESWDDVLALDPDMFEAYTEFSRLPADRGVLSPILRELIYIAIDAVATHLYAPGITLHAVNALRLGATVDQIMSAIEIASLIGATPYLDTIDRL